MFIKSLAKSIAILLIIYFALLHDSDKKDHLRNRLAPEKVIQNIHHLSQQSKNIQKNLKEAKEFEKKQKLEEEKEENNQINQ